MPSAHPIIVTDPFPEGLDPGTAGLRTACWLMVNRVRWLPAGLLLRPQPELDKKIRAQVRRAKTLKEQRFGGADSLLPG